ARRPRRHDRAPEGARGDRGTGARRPRADGVRRRRRPRRHGVRGGGHISLAGIGSRHHERAGGGVPHRDGASRRAGARQWRSGTSAAAPILDVVTCPSCGATVPDGARFCHSCGHGFAGRGDERRVVTVLFADLVGFTRFSETADPEHVKNIVDRAFERLVADVQDCGGRIDKIVGDAIVALFGAPVAHEDDPERAVRAGLQMQESLSDMTDEAGIEVRMRVGINTGEVLFGTMRAGGDYTAMGDAVNSAERLQTAAQPGQVIVGRTTYLATRDSIRYKPLGEVQARGREEPIEAWAALETVGLPGTRPRRPRTPLIGRDDELEILRRALGATANRHRAHLVRLLGEAGVGKSRLAEELSDL